MNSVRELLHQIPDPNLSTDERVRLRCELAKQFEKIGNHEAASRAMGDSWPGFGKAPNLEGLDERTSAEVLLRVGVLTGWIGITKLIKDSQKDAKNLINKSIAIFESLCDVKKVAEAQMEMALCCVNEDALDAARALYAEALAQLDDEDGDLKVRAVLRSAELELVAKRLNDAFSILTTAIALFEASSNHVLRGCFHNVFARVLTNLGVAESRPDYIERALNEYAAASFHLEQAGHARYQGCVENNLALLFLHVRRFAEAHEHLDRAQALFTRLDDRFCLAQIEETRARVLLAEGAVLKAEQIAHVAFRTLEKGDLSSSVVGALTTQGIALSRLQRTKQARTTFERAINIAAQADDPESAGLATLTLLEQLFEQLSEDELCSIIERARSFLKHTQNTALLHRLTECACRVLSVIHTAHPDWTTFSLNETLRRHEARFIQMALEDCGGSVTKAAGFLNLPGHQTLSFMLNTRHQELLKARTPIKPRRRRMLKLISLK